MPFAAVSTSPCSVRVVRINPPARAGLLNDADFAACFREEISSRQPGKSCADNSDRFHGYSGKSDRLRKSACLWLLPSQAIIEKHARVAEKRPPLLSERKPVAMNVNQPVADER